MMDFSLRKESSYRSIYELRAVCLFEQKSSDVVVSLDNEEAKRGFISAMMLPSNQGLQCITADQQFLFYTPMEYHESSLHLTLSKTLIGYNEEISDMKFLGDDEQFIAVSPSFEQVRVYDIASMSCAYVLAGHTDVVLCLDTCVTVSGKTLVVTGSKNNNIRVWDAERQSCLGVGKRHMGSVGAIAFSRKQRNFVQFVVSVSSDRTLKVWSLDGLPDDSEGIPNLKAKAVVAAHDKDINSIAIAPNDSLVCSGSQDRTAQVIMTSESCRNGTERCNEVLEKLGKSSAILQCLNIYPELPPTPLQLEEDLEQLKVLENGYKMKFLQESELL